MESLGLVLVLNYSELPFCLILYGLRFIWVCFVFHPIILDSYLR